MVQLYFWICFKDYILDLNKIKKFKFFFGSIFCQFFIDSKWFIFSIPKLYIKTILKTKANLRLRLVKLFSSFNIVLNFWSEQWIKVSLTTTLQLQQPKNLIVPKKFKVGLSHGHLGHLQTFKRDILPFLLFLQFW